MNIDENKQQNKPATATVVNFGVFFLHLKETEKIEKPNAEARPKTRPGIVFFSTFLEIFQVHRIPSTVVLFIQPSLLLTNLIQFTIKPGGLKI